MVKFKVFGKWDVSNVQVYDPGLKSYVNLGESFVAKNCGRNVNNRFWKSKNHIVERLMNKLQVPGHRGKKHYRTSGHCTGKWIHVYNVTKKCLENLEQQTKENPIQVFIKALENAAPREEITTIEYGGARYPQAVDCSPQRRIDLALKNFVVGAYNRSFGKKTKIENALAEEILLAYRCDQGGFAVSKKLELERQADSSR